MVPEGSQVTIPSENLYKYRTRGSNYPTSPGKFSAGDHEAATALTLLGRKALECNLLCRTEKNTSATPGETSPRTTHITDLVQKILGMRKLGNSFYTPLVQTSFNINLQSH